MAGLHGAEAQCVLCDMFLDQFAVVTSVGPSLCFFFSYSLSDAAHTSIHGRTSPYEMTRLTWWTFSACCWTHAATPRTTGLSATIIARPEEVFLRPQRQDTVQLGVQPLDKFHRDLGWAGRPKVGDDVILNFTIETVDECQSQSMTPIFGFLLVVSTRENVTSVNPLNVVTLRSSSSCRLQRVLIHWLLWCSKTTILAAVPSM